MRPFVLLQAPPAPTGTAQSADDRGMGFKAVEGGQEMQSGERLLVIAYMVIWVLILGFVAFSFRKQARLDARIQALETALAKSRSAEKATPEKGSH